MKYNTIDLLDLHIENIVKRHVKHYYTDWKNYDRPYYMKLKGSPRKADKKLILIVRDCGTYLYTIDELYNYDFGRTVCTYYGESASYYSIDIDNLTCKKMSFNEVKQVIRNIEIELQERKATAWLNI